MKISVMTGDREERLFVTYYLPGLAGDDHDGCHRCSDPAPMMRLANKRVQTV